MPETPPPHPLPTDPDAVPAEAGLLGRLINGISSLFAFGFVLSMSVLILEIFMRHLFDAPTLWAHETTTFICATGFIFGGLYCAVRNKHIRVVPIYDAVPPHIRRWFDICIYFVCAISTGFFSYAAWLMVQRSIFAPDGTVRFETSGSAWNPPAPALLKLFLLAVLCIMTIQFLVFCVSHLRKKGGNA